MYSGRNVAVAPLARLPASARGMAALSVITGPSLVGPALPVSVLGIPEASWASAEGRVMAYFMAVKVFHVCYRAVALGMFVTASCTLDILVRYGNGILVY